MHREKRPKKVCGENVGSEEKTFERIMPENFSKWWNLKTYRSKNFSGS